MYINSKHNTWYKTLEALITGAPGEGPNRHPCISTIDYGFSISRSHLYKKVGTYTVYTL